MANWVERKFSRMQIERAGKTLIADGVPEDERLQAQEVLDNWRACHSFPMNTFQATLRYVARKTCGRTFIVAQRLKRTPSILNKLRKEQHMSLKRMQDIAGCRAIVKDIDSVYRIMDYYKDMNLEHELVITKDYLNNPKESGYRSVHLVYKYKGTTRTAFDDQLVEVQLRTQLQHAWATAVEIVDTMNRSAIKFGRGDAKWDRFFRLVSAVFALEENTGPVPGMPTDPDALISEASELIMELKVAYKLLSFNQMFALPQSLHKAEYYLMRLSISDWKLNVQGFGKKQANIATERYQEAEEAARDNPDVQVVLVSAGSVHALKKAYPNYYADSTLFVNKLTDMLTTDTARLNNIKEQKEKRINDLLASQGPTE